MKSFSRITILCLTATACLSLFLYSDCNRDTDSAQNPPPTPRPAVNVYGARELDPVVIRQAIKKAWNNYQTSLGIEISSKGTGMTDTEIDFIESEMRQKLPEDLKAFLRLRNGGRFNDGFHMMDSGEIVDWWKFLVDLNYVNTVNEETLQAPPVGATPTWHGEPFLIPLMQEDTDEIHFDIRTGKVIEMMDGPCGVLADSLVELLDELAKQNRAGRIVTRYSLDGKELGPFLNSKLWKVYEPQ